MKRDFYFRLVDLLMACIYLVIWAETFKSTFLAIGCFWFGSWYNAAKNVEPWKIIYEYKHLSDVQQNVIVSQMQAIDRLRTEGEEWKDL